MQNIFYQGNKRKQVPSNHDQAKLLSFFNCAATLMTDQIQNLAFDSISDYTDLLCQPPVSVVAGHTVVKLLIFHGVGCQASWPVRPTHENPGHIGRVFSGWGGGGECAI